MCECVLIKWRENKVISARTSAVGELLPAGGIRRFWRWTNGGWKLIMSAAYLSGSSERIHIHARTLSFLVSSRRSCCTTPERHGACAHVCVCVCVECVCVECVCVSFHKHTEKTPLTVRVCEYMSGWAGWPGNRVHEYGQWRTGVDIKHDTSVSCPPPPPLESGAPHQRNSEYEPRR